MKHRSLGKMFLLFIVTFGIYRLVWFAETRRELMSLKPVKIPSIWLFIAPIFLIVGSLGLLLFSTINETIKADSACRLTTTGSQEREQCVTDSTQDLGPVQALAMVGVYASIFAFAPLTAWWLWHYSKAVEQVTAEKLSFAMTILVLIAVPDGLDMLVVQDTYNKIANTKNKPATA